MLPQTENPPDCRKLCQQIAGDIEALKDRFPQLAEFEPADSIEGGGCRISYAHRCHQAVRRAGWAGGVPNPDPDGLWFYIGLWDENDPNEATAQINTQPVMPDWRIGKWRVTFLILQGAGTRSVERELVGVMEKYGMR